MNHAAASSPASFRRQVLPLVPFRRKAPLQLCFLLWRKRGFDDPPTKTFQFRHHLFRLHLADQHEQRRRAIRDGFTQRFDEIVVDPVIRQRPRKRTRSRTDRAADRKPRERIEEQQANEATPETTGEKTGACTDRRQIDALLQVHLAVFIANDDDGIFQID